LRHALVARDAAVTDPTEKLAKGAGFNVLWIFGDDDRHP
jgi:hypothetical protein